jgi:hypothetical protein
MKEEIAFRKSKRLRHTRQHFDLFNALSNWAVDEAGGPDRVFGTKPGTAPYSETDLGAEANKAVKANTANYDDILKLLDRMIPNYSESLKQGGKNTLSLLRGELPADVESAVKRSAAFKSLAGGFSGSPMSRALTARDFGKTSLDLMQLGGNSAQLWTSLAQSSAKPFMVTAPDQAEAGFRNNLYRQITEQNRLNVLSAPDPGAAGIFNLQTAMGAMAASFGMGSAMGAQSGSNAIAAANARNPQNQGGMGNTAGGGGMSGGATSLGNWWGG